MTAATEQAAFEQLLAHVSRKIQLEEKEIGFFRSKITVRNYRKRQYLLQAGDLCKHEIYVFKGCLRAYSVNEKAEEHIVQFAVDDWWISDLYSFLTGQPARYNIEAVEDSTVVLIEKNALEELYTEIPKLERLFRMLMQNSFVALQERVVSSMSQSAEERYLNFLQRYPQIEQRIPQHMIASFLGITPEFLSRTRKKLVSGKK